MEMFNPPHPGEIVRDDCLIPLGLSVADGAKRLGVSRQSLSELLNGRNGISATLALRLEKAGWSIAEDVAGQPNLLRPPAGAKSRREREGARGPAQDQSSGEKAHGQKGRRQARPASEEASMTVRNFGLPMTRKRSPSGLRTLSDADALIVPLFHARRCV